MRPNPFLRFHRAAEAAGYPAVLLVTTVALTMMVSAISLLALVPAAWTFLVAMLMLVAAIALVSGAIAAALNDDARHPS